MISDIEVLFVAGFGPIVRDVDRSVALYRDTLGLPLEGGGEEPDYFHTGEIDGVKHFALWPLHGAALSCFGKAQWGQTATRLLSPEGVLVGVTLTPFFRGKPAK